MKKAGRIVIIVAIIIALFAVIFLSSSTKTPNSEQVLDTQTTLGDLEAKNYYVLYTDLTCPYCAVLGQTIVHNEDEFEKWLSDNNVLWEVRITDFLYEYSGSEYSRPAAEATYCAKNEGKFWDFYRAAMEKMYQDYQSKGINVSKTSPRMTNLPDDYWNKIGKSVGLGEKFDNCLKNHESLAEVEAVTEKAAKEANGVPYVIYNGKEGNIDGTNGWNTLRSYLETGLK